MESTKTTRSATEGLGAVKQVDASPTMAATVPLAATADEQGTDARRIWTWVAVPGLAILAVATIGPLVWIVIRSMSGDGLANYVELLSPVYLRSFAQTIYFSLLVAVVTTVISYPFAYAIKVGPTWLKAVLISTLVIAFASADVSRTFGWQTLLQNTGVINVVLLDWGWIETPLPLMYNDFGAVLGTSSVLLPFGVLTIFANIRNVNPDVVVAAQTLGASRLSAVLRILVPMTIPGIAISAGLVFVLTLGFYVTPARLGDPTRPMITGLIVEATSFGNFERAAALSVVLLLLTLVIGGIVSGVTTIVRKRAGK